MYTLHIKCAEKEIMPIHATSYEKMISLVMEYMLTHEAYRSCKRWITNDETHKVCDIADPGDKK